MKEEIRTRWIAKLRDPKYIQHKKSLGRPEYNQFCCLGVLCEVYREDHPGVEWIHDEKIGKSLFLGSSGHLPFEVVKWAGLKDNNPETSKIYFLNSDEKKEYPCKAPLSVLNDRYMNFNEIADQIERDF